MCFSLLLRRIKKKKNIDVMDDLEALEDIEDLEDDIVFLSTS